MTTRPKTAGSAPLAIAGAARGVAEALLARISHSDEPAAIVAAASPLDLLASLREADDEQRVELLALMDREQIVCAIDLACWRGGAFLPGELLAMIAPAAATGIDAAARLFFALDGELRTLLLEPYVVIHLREDKNDDFDAAEGSELFECADGSYAIELPNPDDVPQPIRQILAALLYRPFEEYHLELECLRHDLPSELEEAAVRWRSGRLADLGFAPFEESAAAIAPADPEAVRRRITAAPGPRASADLPLPELYGRCLGGAALLDAALERVATSDDPAFAERAGLLPAELGAAVSLFLSGARVEIGDLEEATSGIRLARDTLALGLGAATGGDVELAARGLIGLPPIWFIRAGLGVLSPLRDRARALRRKLGVAVGGDPLGVLDPPHAVVIELLSREIPRRFPPLDEGGAVFATPVSPFANELAGFNDPAQVALYEALLAEAERVPDLLAALGALKERPVPPPSIALLAALPGAFGMGAEELCLRALRELSGPLEFAEAGGLHEEGEPEPRRRLVLRSLRIGLARELPQSTR
jgi:hypothetical protein